MRDSADSDDYGVTRRGKKRGKFRYDEATYEKRNRHQPKLAAEDAHDEPTAFPKATGGRPGINQHQLNVVPSRTRSGW